MGVLAWIVLGFISGAMVKAFSPARYDYEGFVMPTIVSIVGAFLGGFLGNMLTGTDLNGFSFWSILLAIVGSLLLFWIYRVATARS